MKKFKKTNDILLGNKLPGLTALLALFILDTTALPGVGLAQESHSAPQNQSNTGAAYNTASVQIKSPLPQTSAANKIDRFQRSFAEAEKAMRERRFDSCRKFLAAADHEARQSALNHDRSSKVRLLEAQLANRTGRPIQALSILKTISGGDRALVQSEMAEAEVVQGRFVPAETHSRAAIIEFENRKSNGDSEELDSQLGLANLRLARAMAGQGFADEAKPFFSKARTLLTAVPGPEQLDLADALRCEAIFYRSIGDTKVGGQLFEHSCRIREAVSDPERSAALSGEVRFEWEPGSPRCHEIIDNEFPLRYITANQIRVAATVVDLWELAGIIVCVTNLDDHRRTADLGPLNVYHAVRGPGHSLIATAPLSYVDHKIIDRLRRERNIWDLTQDRPWLANIQKTRNFRGLVPSDGHDMFRGPNVFGVWGEWAGISHVVSKVGVTVQPSRENLFHRNADDDASKDSGLVRSELQQSELVPISLEPLESRTGEKFYIYPRNEPIKIDVVVGNTTFSFPFQCRKQRI